MEVADFQDAIDSAIFEGDPNWIDHDIDALPILVEGITGSVDSIHFDKAKAAIVISIREDA